MSDADVADALRSDQKLVVVEAPAGCGKTWQGAAYAKDVISGLGSGRLLVLTHTHAACDVFAGRTAGAGSRVEVRTIDGLIMSVATAYRLALDLPADLSAWGWKGDGAGFDELAEKVAVLVTRHPMVAAALANRYPTIICDEHQDTSAAQHATIMAIYRAGAKLRVFGDPLQALHAGNTEAAMQENWRRWETLKRAGLFAALDHPHRWDGKSPELGEWIIRARVSLLKGEPVDLGLGLPKSVYVLSATNTAKFGGLYLPALHEKKPIYKHVQALGEVMILGSTNELVRALRAFWGRQIPIWEGHTRKALGDLVTALQAGAGNPEAIANAVIAFMSSVGAGFSMSSHGDLLLREVKEGCERKTTGKPANVQRVAKCILDNPNHIGVAEAVRLVLELADQKAAGFDEVKIDHRTEFRDAMRFDRYADPAEALTEISRHRVFVRPSPPARAIGSIHKSKGLEFKNVVVMACDKASFGNTTYGRCKLYVAMSRATKSLTFVVPDPPSPLLKAA